MRAIAIVPGRPETAGVYDIPEPPKSDGSVLVRTLSIGLCGTDLEIALGGYGVPPPGEERLVLGHESIGEVIDAPEGSGLEPGNLVVGIVRRPDPVPCAACAADEWDMCRNGLFVERGIKEHHGYGSTRFRIDPRFAVRIDSELGHLGVLLEPTSVVAKAWEQAERIGARGQFRPRLALVTGSGPVGPAAFQAAPGAVIALTGFSQSQSVAEMRLDALNKALVLGNKIAFGTVSAARRHYDQAAEALARADPDWLARLITRRLAPEDWPNALQKRSEDIKVIVDMTTSS